MGTEGHERNSILLALPTVPPNMQFDSARPQHRLLELVRLFAWLGVIGIGGPAAHIAMMRRRVVTNRSWVSEDEFAQMVGACALVPGPNSTEMAMAIGA